MLNFQCNSQCVCVCVTAVSCVDVTLRRLRDSQPSLCASLQGIELKSESVGDNSFVVFVRFDGYTNG